MFTSASARVASTIYVLGDTVSANHSHLCRRWLVNGNDLSLEGQTLLVQHSNCRTSSKRHFIKIELIRRHQCRCRHPRPVICVKAPFDTPDVSRFACSPWGQHSIIQCGRFVTELSPVQRSLLLTQQQRCFCCRGQTLNNKDGHSVKTFRIADRWCVKCQQSDHHTLLSLGKKGSRQFLTVKGWRPDKKKTY